MKVLILQFELGLERLRPPADRVPVDEEACQHEGVEQRQQLRSRAFSGLYRRGEGDHLAAPTTEAFTVDMAIRGSSTTAAGTTTLPWRGMSLSRSDACMASRRSIIISHTLVASLQIGLDTQSSSGTAMAKARLVVVTRSTRSLSSAADLWAALVRYVLVGRRGGHPHGQDRQTRLASAIQPSRFISGSGTACLRALAPAAVVCHLPKAATL